MTSALLPLLLVAACDGREESAIDNLANGANQAQVQNNVRAEAMALMERKGEEVSRTRLAAELSVARARIDAVFPEESDLLEAGTAEWLQRRARQSGFVVER